MQKRSGHRLAGAGRKTQAGFTLLELVVTMMVSSLVVLAAYQLFASTSEAMYEANSLSDTTDRARFGLELIARDVRSAGAFGSPDSNVDPLTNQNQIGLRNVRGIYAITDNQARQVGDVQREWNRATRSDELIMLGAYDFPFKFEVRFPTGGADFNTAFAPNTNEGALRFRNLDPFIVEPEATTDLGTLTAPVLDTITARVMRVTDRNGFSQFVSVDAASYTAGLGNGLTFDLDPGPDALQERPEAPLATENPRAGLEPGADDDVGYEAALLDAYRYRVCTTLANPNRLRLVRERINAQRLVNNEAPPVDDLCQGGAVNVGPGNYVLEQQLVVDRVADFQVWYDCILPGDELMEGSLWATQWTTPGTASTAEHNCAYIDNAGVAISGENTLLTRMAHIRLSVHTENERGGVSNYGFLRQDGTTVNDSAAVNAPQFITSTSPLPNDVIGNIQTFDINGDAANSARVVTMQIDVQLTNYINRASMM